MINYAMKNNYFHNSKSIIKNIDIKQTFTLQSIDPKRRVDINKLLNKVKIEKKIETKQKIIFYSFIIMGLSLLGTLITFLK